VSSEGQSGRVPEGHGRCQAPLQKCNGGAVTVLFFPAEDVFGSVPGTVAEVRQECDET